MKKIVQLIFKKFGYLIISDKNEALKKIALLDPFNAQESLFANKKDLLIFDVGAHHGETAIEYKRRFSHCRIFSFEPFKESFDILKKNICDYTGIDIFNIALGDTIGSKNFNSNSFSATNSILDTHEEGSATWGNNLLETIAITEVNITTIDDFAVKQQVREIDILKIDVQGYEYNVIEGCKKLIANNGIKIIYLEIIILPTYKNQKYFDELLNLLRSYNFSLYNLYNFSYDSFGALRQLDAIFINNTFKNSIFV